MCRYIVVDYKAVKFYSFLSKCNQFTFSDIIIDKGIFRCEFNFGCEVPKFYSQIKPYLSSTSICRGTFIPFSLSLSYKLARSWSLILTDWPMDSNLLRKLRSLTLFCAGLKKWKFTHLLFNFSSICLLIPAELFRFLLLGEFLKWFLNLIKGKLSEYLMIYVIFWLSAGLVTVSFWIYVINSFDYCEECRKRLVKQKLTTKSIYAKIFKRKINYK